MHILQNRRHIMGRRKLPYRFLILMARPKKTVETLSTQADLTRQFVSAVEAHCHLRQAARGLDAQRRPALVKSGKICAKTVEELLGFAQPTGRTWNAYRRGDRSWPLATLDGKLRLAERARLLSPEMASALKRKLTLAALAEIACPRDPLIDRSHDTSQQLVSIAEIYRQQNGAENTLHLLQVVLDYAEQLRAEVARTDISTDPFCSISPPDDC